MKNTKIKVVGVGGAGGNALSRMKRAKIRGVELIAINADFQDLKKTKADLKIQIGKNLTKGLGTGMNPNLGKKAAEEQKEEITQALRNSDLVFITAGFGGGVGTGASPVVAEIAKNLGALTVAVVTKPFLFEGRAREMVAERGLENLKDKVDTLIVIPNQRVVELVAKTDRKMTLNSAFWAGDEILREAVQGVTELISVPGIINVDFSSLRTVLEDSGRAFFGIGKAQGEGRAERVVREALDSPLIDWTFVNKPKGILFNISGSPAGDLSLAEVEKIAKILTENIDQKAKVIFGAVQDKSLKKGEIKLTLILTGF